MKAFLLVHNVAKKHNVGTLLRDACAFNVEEVIAIGKSTKMNTFGAHGADKHVRKRHFFTLNDCREYLVDKMNASICGVEICKNAIPIQNHPFSTNTAFLLGNEGRGLTQEEMDICDFFVYIPQYGAGIASLNVAVASAIVLHHFAIWANYQECSKSIETEYKFQDDNDPTIDSAIMTETRELRLARKRNLPNGEE